MMAKIGVTRADDPEMQDLLELAARLGRDPLAIQGPAQHFPEARWRDVGEGERHWRWEATARSILVPVDIAAVLDGLAADDPACETCSAFVRHDLVHSPLRPSIETTLHAVMAVPEGRS